jgi:hypothetical protein
MEVIPIRDNLADFRPFGMRVKDQHLYVLNEGYGSLGETVNVYRIVMDAQDNKIDHL